MGDWHFATDPISSKFPKPKEKIMDNYIEQAVTTESPITPEVISRLNKVVRIIHGILGLMTEIGEFADPIKKYIFYGKEIDWVNLEEEMGDKFWYCAILLDEMGFRTGIDHTFESVMRKNINKLRKRYPNLFTEKDALNRDLEAERKVLEREEEEALHSSYMVEENVITKEEFDSIKPLFGGELDEVSNSFKEIDPAIGREDEPIGRVYYNEPDKIYMRFVFDLKDEEDYFLSRDIKKLLFHTKKYKDHFNKLEQLTIAYNETLPPLKAEKTT